MITLSKGAAWFVRAFCGWTVYVWGTRIWNIVENPDHSTAFKVVHSALAAVSVAFAVGTLFLLRPRRD